MAAPIRPNPVKVYGKDKWVFVQTIANINAPTQAEVIAGTTLDITMMAFDGEGYPTSSTNRPVLERRIGDTVTYEQIGTQQITGGTMMFQLDPQSAALSNGKKAWEKFVAGTTGYLVRRMGTAVATDLATGQFVTVYPVEYAAPFPTKVGDGESAEAGFASEYAVTGPIASLVAIA